MRQRLPLVLSIMALVVALAGTGGPALAKVVRHAVFAKNAGKVDGKSAVGASAGIAARRGKLVATSPTSGLLPNNIIAKAPDANLLDGLDSTRFLRSTSAAGGDLTGAYPRPRIGPGAVTSAKLADGAVTSDKLADGAVGLSKLAPEVGLGFFTGRITGLDAPSPSNVGFGAPLGLSQRGASPGSVTMPSPDRPIRASDLTASVTVPVEDSISVIVEAMDADGLLVTGSGFRCTIRGPSQTGCTNEGSSSDVVPPGSFVFIEYDGPQVLPAGEDLLFSWRAQPAQ